MFISHRTSQYFLPIKKNLSSDVILKSHQLMLKAGLIKQVSSGLYAWLPLGMRVLHKVSNIIR
ncbi:MAG: proline--tRNA ligase, partial [Proteobacteria bacterium]|nr:proline--tRNA ligase [Pseudomonadota bacterium]